MVKELIGIIVPIYRVERYIAECIESILAQTYTNFRLILVDDGSPDNAGKICDEYAKKDSRITVIHQENTGVTRARARGVEEADDCEFITFVDGDDELTKDAIEIMFSRIDDNTDIVVSSRNDTFQTNKSIDTRTYRSYIITEKIQCGPVAKLFRTSLFDKETFNIDKRIVAYEDLIMNIRLSLNTSKNISVIENVTYIYRHNPDSASKRFKDNDEFEIRLYESLKESFTKEELNIHMHDIVEHFLHRWDKEFGYNYKDAGWNEWQVRKLIIDDIKIYQCNGKTMRRLIFCTKVSFFKYILITIRKFNNTINRLISS